MILKKNFTFFVKYNKLTYSIYYFIGNLVLKLLKIKLVCQDNLVLFVSFGGKKYDDSPKCIYEAMIKDKRFSNIEYVWAFNEPNKYILPKGRCVKIDTINFFIVALKARCWITNSSVERGLSFKNKYTYLFNTWHGTPIKKMGVDIPLDNTSFRSKSKSTINILLAQSQYDQILFSKAFECPLSQIHILGLPRNDELIGDNKNRVMLLKRKLNIPIDRKIILYAPTFREYTKDGTGCVLNLPVCFDKWENVLSEKYIVLFRAHYEVCGKMNICNKDFIIDVSLYPDLNDLMLVSDFLISDYSSIFFDYSIMDKPMLCFAYDYDRYNRERGLYFDIRKELSDEIIENEDQLLDKILHLDYQKSIQRTIAFRNKYVTEYGHATSKSLDILAKNIL